MEDEKNIQFYCFFDNNGTITTSLLGAKIHPDVAYDYFTMITQEVAENINDYKIALVGMKLELALKTE